MGKILIVYASMTGNTQSMAKYIAEGVKEAGYPVEVKDAVMTNVEELPKYDGILIGAYSWDGVPDEILDIYDGLAEIDLKGKKAAVFGSGDSMYDEFCIAVDEVAKQLQKCGANVVLEGLKVELAPEGDDIERCKEFGRQFVQTLK